MWQGKMEKNCPFSNPASDSSHTDLIYEFWLLFIIQFAVLVMANVHTEAGVGQSCADCNSLCSVYCVHLTYMLPRFVSWDTHTHRLFLFAITHTRHHYSHHTRGHTSLHNCTSHAVDVMTKAWAICASQHCLQRHNELVRTDAIYSIIGRACVCSERLCFGQDDRLRLLRPIQTGMYSITCQNLPLQDQSNNIRAIKSDKDANSSKAKIKTQEVKLSPLFPCGVNV